MCKVYTGNCGTSDIEHDFCACTVDNPLTKARGLSLRTGAQTMLSHINNTQEVSLPQNGTPHGNIFRQWCLHTWRNIFLPKKLTLIGVESSLSSSLINVVNLHIFDKE